MEDWTLNVDFSDRLRELSSAQLQAMSEDDITAYALTVPQLTAMYITRDKLLKDCADMASTNHAEENIAVRDDIIRDREESVRLAEENEKLRKTLAEKTEAYGKLRKVSGTVG